jgi:AraC family transcriptional regulator of adaptative response/methylated-DNA-[protein]-cysteine methyltransferase
MTLPPKKEMERARLNRDAAYDGIFFVGVRTTGIFCRPSCPAKTPRAANVVYWATLIDAVRAGYRPCRRCRPEQTNARTPKWVARLLDLLERTDDRKLRDADLKTLGFEPTRARRHFRQHFGLTFQAYQRARRMGVALRTLRQGADPLAVGWSSGYDSSSGFRSAFGRQFGVTPKRSTDMQTIVTQTVESPIGLLRLGATEKGVCLVEFADRPALPTELKQLNQSVGPLVPGTNGHLAQMADELARYFSGTLTEFTVPLDIVRGTPFQRRVWDRLLEIPYGQTMSYGELAKAIGRPGAQRPVGAANGANGIAIVIPCHRVIQSDGKLRGYGGGLWRKQFLLEHEAAVCGACLSPATSGSLTVSAGVPSPGWGDRR